MSDESKIDKTTAAPFGSTVGEETSITRRLRAYYDAVQDEAIPDRFLELLEKLDLAEAQSKLAEQQ